MAFAEEIRGLFAQFVKGFPECSLIFVATSDGLTLWAEGEGKEEELSAYFTNLMGEIRTALEKLGLGEPRSALLVSEKGFYNILPITPSLTLGVIFHTKADYSSLFPALREMMGKIRELAGEAGL